MEKPKPMDLLIEPDASPLLMRTVHIETHTERASMWICATAPEFGELLAEPFKRGIGWSLYVYRAYDRAEVIAYLVNAWESQRWPDEVDLSIEAESKAE